MSGHARCQLQGSRWGAHLSIECCANHACANHSPGAWLLQNSIQSNASARGALAGLRWGSEMEIQPATRSDSAHVHAADGAGGSTTAAPDSSAADDGLAAAAPSPEAQLAAADGGAAAGDDWGQHPRSILGSVASLTGAQGHERNVVSRGLSVRELAPLPDVMSSRQHACGSAGGAALATQNVLQSTT